MNDQPRIVIVGAGPTGTGAAWRLEEHGYENWLLIEASDHPGGLASSVVDDQGFTWDLGGHVLFSHWRYFDRLMDEALGDAWVEHVREAWVWIRNSWVPYPFQNNIWRLPNEELVVCLEGLLDVYRQRPDERAAPRSFSDWLLQAFGPGLCETFMFPYNRKVWGYDPGMLGVGWMGERVASVDLPRVLRNLVMRTDDVGWGPNATFRFPLKGGTGAIWRNLHDRLPRERMKFGLRAVAIDSRTKVLQFSDGTSISYDHLISTMPLDILLRTIKDRPDLSQYAHQFVHSSTHIVGIGFDGKTPPELATKCWMYFPESNTPFYRVTVFSNYSPNNVARPGEQWSLMAEVSETPLKGVRSTIVSDVIDGLCSVGLVDPGTPIASTWHTRLEHGYPTPWLDRDSILNLVQPHLAASSILSRGRFGAWKYEVSNQDQSAMQGVEAVDHILLGLPESTFGGQMGVEPPLARGVLRR